MPFAQTDDNSGIRKPHILAARYEVIRLQHFIALKSESFEETAFIALDDNRPHKGLDTNF